MEKLECEVAIIGAGPAGSSAAIVLAKADYDVLLVGDKLTPEGKACGGGLSPLTYDMLDPDIRDIVVERASHRTALSTFKMDMDVEYYSDDPIIYQTRRSSFDKALLREALSLGADRLVGHVRDVMLLPPFAHIVGWNDDGKFSIHAQVVIDAAGYNGPVCRNLGTYANAAKNASVAWAREFNVGSKFVEEVYGPDYTIRADFDDCAMGYAWAFPKQKHINVGFGCALSSPASRFARKYAEAYVNYLVDEGLLPSNPRSGKWQSGIIPMGGPQGPMSYLRGMVCGDAAGLVSPLSGEGLHYAIESGRMAATQIALANHSYSHKNLSGYGDWCRARWTRDFKYHRIIRRIVGGAPTRVLRRSMKDIEMRRLMVELLQGTSEGRSRGIAFELFMRNIAAIFRRYPNEKN